MTEKLTKGGKTQGPGNIPEQFKKVPIRRDVDLEELNLENNARLFLELPSKNVQIFAIQLARPDGFLKTLITGEIATSAELRKKFPTAHTKTHRGDYLGRPNDEGEATNNYLSFKVGLPDDIYGDMGFLEPAEKFLSRPEVDPEAEPGGVLLDSADYFKTTPQFEPGLNGAVSFLRENPLAKYVPKNILIDVIHASRKSGILTGKNSPEAHIFSENDDESLLPRLSISGMLVLIPEKNRDALVESLSLVLEDNQKISGQIREMFGVDITKLSAEQILQSKQIYWYPQDTIIEAITYLSTHKKRLEELLEKK